MFPDRLHAEWRGQRGVRAARDPFRSWGEMDAAFGQLDRALALRDPALVYLAVGPQWDSLRNDPRFNEQLRRMELPSGCAS